MAKNKNLEKESNFRLFSIVILGLFAMVFVLGQTRDWANSGSPGLQNSHMNLNSITTKAIGVQIHEEESSTEYLSTVETEAAAEVERVNAKGFWPFEVGEKVKLTGNS